MCELAKGGMIKVEYAETSIDKKLNHAWNCSTIKVTYRASILQLKAREGTQNGDTKSCLKFKEKRIWPLRDLYNQKN